jgi:dihydropteroate synthase
MCRMTSYAWKLRDREYPIGLMPLVMGIVNVTPDSFSDGGRYFAHEAAVEHGLSLVQDGADLLDVGGESTRPGSRPVSAEEELRRIEPVVAALARQTKVPISIDTSKATVAARALKSGASVINDVTGLTGDSRMAELAKESRAGLIVMHMQGTPATMQEKPTYSDVVREVHDFLEVRLAALADVGIDPQCVALDPGIGFGKRQEHNLDLLAHLEQVRSGGRPICLGVSRKGFINRVLGKAGAVEEGDAGTVGVVLEAVGRGAAQIVRVHNVKAVVEALRLMLAIRQRRQAVGE